MSVFTSLENKVIRRLSVRRQILTGESLLETEEMTLSPQLVIGRDLCRFFTKGFDNVPKSQREQALKAQLLATSMWERTDYCVVWDGSFAQVWFWDAAHIDGLMAQYSKTSGIAYRTDSVWVMPETVLWSRPQQDGLFLYCCNRGFDLQYRQKGRLVASQWFSNVPDSHQVRRFSRSQGIQTLPQALSASQPEKSESPWAGIARPENFASQPMIKKVAVFSGIFVVLVLLLQLLAIGRWSMVEKRHIDRIQELEVSAQNVLEARGRARQALSDYERLAAIFAVPETLSAQLLFSRRLPDGHQLRLRNWQRSIDQVEVTVEGEISDYVEMIAAFDNEGFSDPVVEQSRIPGQHVIRIRLDSNLGQALEAEL